MTDEALKLALEALESGVKMESNRIAWIEYDSWLMKGAITAIKEALAQPDYRAVKTYHEGKPVYVAQPEQEPVAWVCYWGDKKDIDFEQIDVDALAVGTMLYTSPQQPQPEQNLNCKSVQARLATAWGYVKAKQEPSHIPLITDEEWEALNDI
ncbi:hypothetical protein UFOVP43_24 [uncultured Caudovirales phage]|uniref:Uncharacterized protein n=1 Tax=uncultured Caudovirales phage TaxID=2100421 RepID=A0A6J5KR06_9CAUD|nr:hypothetical protein UFOVP43_24 [uncultured Caudovirales phage]